MSAKERTERKKWEMKARETEDNLDDDQKGKEGGCVVRTKRRKKETENKNTGTRGIIGKTVCMS